MELIRANEICLRILELFEGEDAEKLRLIQLRQILEQTYKDLTADVPMSFNGLFARMQYFHETHGTKEALVKQMNTLRILCNKVTHDELPHLKPGSAASGALGIYDLLKDLHQDLHCPGLEKLLAGARPFERRQAAKKSSFSGVLLSWQYQEQSGRRHALELKVMSEDGEQLTLILRDDKKNLNKAKYTALYPSLWKYANLNCLNLSEVAGKPGYYIDNHNTIIVLEPDFLVDASSIAECMDAEQSHPELFVLSRLFSEPSSDKMLMGQLVNSMFDALIQEPGLEYPTLFKDALTQAAIPMVALGRASSLDIYKSIETEHLPQLQSFAETMAEKDLLLEPSYLCPKYGLQGRLDLLYREKKKFSIVELKSGKAHPTDIWPSQTYQVVAYNMIIRNAYGTEALGSSSIFYSAAGQSLRNVANMPLQEQNLINCRNRIVGIMHLLCEEPAKFFNWLSRYSAEAYSSFMTERLERFKRLYLAMRDYEKEWFLEQIKRLSREIWQVKLGSTGASEEHYYGHNALWQLSTLQKSGKIITSLKQLGQNGRILEFALPGEIQVTDFRNGDIVILYDQSRTVDRQEIIRGLITNLQDDKLEIKIRAGTRNNPRFKDGTLWALEHDTLESLLYAPYASVSSFLESDSSRRDLLLGISEPCFRATPASGDGLDEVLDRMHKAKDLHIVQGPPGTGKTSGLLSRYIEEFYHNTTRRMLVISFTNRAVDEICLNLQKRAIPFIRTGNSQRVEDTLLSKVIADKRFVEIEELLKSNRIYVCTVQSANGYFKDLSSIIELDEILVDEASQILEPTVIGMLAQVPKCILIGDQNQLPAISVQGPLGFDFKHPSLRELQYGSINQSLMERLYRLYRKKEWLAHIDMLKAHYRMHDSIAALVAPYYQDQLYSSTAAQKADLEINELVADFDSRLIWIECPVSAEDYFDTRQVSLIRQIVQRFATANELQDPESDLGIVAPYRAMIHALKKEVKDHTIDTVERFQGSERKIIILCLPFRKAKSLKHMQALSEDGIVDRKLIVAVSRARERLIILGNSDLCRQARHYKELIKHIQNYGKIINYQELGVQNG